MAVRETKTTFPSPVAYKIPITSSMVHKINDLQSLDRLGEAKEVIVKYIFDVRCRNVFHFLGVEPLHVY